MKTRHCVKVLWSWLAAGVLLAACECSTCWAAQEASSKDVEAKIQIGVAAAKAEEAMNARQPVKAVKLLLDLVKKYPRNVSALHEYYDFLLNHRIKLSDEERAAALEYARTTWPDVESLEDVFLSVCGEQGIKELFARLADDDEALTRAFTELESAFQNNDLKSLAFDAFVATAHADKAIAQNGRLGVAELLLRRGDYEAAEMEFVWRSPSLFASRELYQRAKLGVARCRERLGRTEEAIRDYEETWRGSPTSDAGVLAAERVAELRLRQDKPACAMLWCLRIASNRPSHRFSDKQVQDLYSRRRISLQGYGDTLASSVRRELETETSLTEQSRKAREGLLRLLTNLGEEGREEGEADLSRKLRARGLLLLSSSIQDLFRDPSGLVGKAEDMGQLANMLWGPRMRVRDTELDETLLEANDPLIASGLGEALKAHASGSTNGDRLAAAYLYYSLTHGGKGRERFERLLSSLSRELDGLEKASGSREFSESLLSVSKAAGLADAMKEEGRPLVEYDMTSANDAAALRELAKRAEASGNFDLAVAALERIQWEFSGQVDMADLTFTLGEAYFTNHQFDRAKEAFAAYLRPNPRDEARRTEAQYLSALSDFYSGDFGAAAINLFAFATNNPHSEFAQVALAVAGSACDDYHRSRLTAPERKKELFLGLTKRFPDTQVAAEAHYYLGQLMVKPYKEYHSALGHFEAALAGNHADDAAYHIGLCYELLGELDEAEKWFRKVVAESKLEGPRNLSMRALGRLRKTRGSE